MGENSKIEWCDHTLNPWIGCTAISQACANCYAEALSKRTGGPAWGHGQPRRRTSVHTWKQPLTWNRKAAKLGIRYRVFCASLADVFDAEVPDEWRDELFALIIVTPHLDWLLLTKRPKVAHDYLASRYGRPAVWLDAAARLVEAGILPTSAPAQVLEVCARTAPSAPLPNVSLGTTAENQDMLAARWRWLGRTPAVVRFLSMEPLLGEVDLSETFGLYEPEGGGWALKVGSRWEGSPDWVITGGESGGKARPSHPDWYRSIRDQCAAAGVPFLFKQWGEWIDERQATAQGSAPGDSMFGVGGMPKGDRWHFYDGNDVVGGAAIRLGKKAAGRLLDGVEHNGFPEAR